jgi:hypothetical protein
MAQPNPAPVVARAPEPPPPEASRSGAKVTVACKLPAGLVIRAHKLCRESEAVMGGGTRDYDVYRWSGEEKDEAHIFGNATPFGKAPKCLIIGGYALTPNVDKDIWDNWFEANRNGAMVKNGLIFAYEKPDHAQAEALNRENVLSGMEPIDPDNPGKKVRGIEKSDRK